MKKIILLLLIAGLITAGFQILTPKSTTEQTKTNKEIVPSETFINYEDPAGFSFSYPDNLSIVKKEIEDNDTYTDLQLTSKDISGSLSLRITDSQYKTLDEWLNLNKGAARPKEVKLGNLKAQEVKLNDRLLLGSLDQGIFFTIEVPLLEEKFWMKVYDKILSEFTFITPENTTSQVNTATDDITFEGEEVVE